MVGMPGLLVDLWPGFWHRQDGRGRGDQDALNATTVAESNRVSAEQRAEHMAAEAERALQVRGLQRRGTLPADGLP